jgi:hypothetical protein
MRGDPQAIAGRLPRVAPERRWASRIADAIEGRRRTRIKRLEVIERRGREERHARQWGHYVPEVKYRVRPW